MNGFVEFVTVSKKKHNEQLAVRSTTEHRAHGHDPSPQPFWLKVFGLCLSYLHSSVHKMGLLWRSGNQSCSVVLRARRRHGNPGGLNSCLVVSQGSVTVYG